MKITSKTISPVIALFLALAPLAMAGTTWYVNGVNGSDNNNCLSSTTACKTIGHAISHASSGDSIRVAAATYHENLGIGESLKIIGASTGTTIIDGGGVGRSVAINSTSAVVSLSRLTVRNGRSYFGGGIFNEGTLTISNCAITGNIARGGGSAGFGGGVGNAGKVTITNSTLSGNSVSGPFGAGFGGGLGNGGTANVTNSTVTGNTATGWRAGIGNEGTLRLSNSTVSANTGPLGAGVGNYNGATAVLQNNILAGNSGGNCSPYNPVTSNGYNLSSDNTCDFSNAGDLNNTNPLLGSLQYNGGPTKTMALPSGSPAIDAGNPSGCTDGQGHLLKTDQRGSPRPDKEDTIGCDIGAYERQTD
jgi:hypothetical protein